MSVNNNLQTGSGRIRVAQFTASGSWTAPAGVYAVNVLAVGGGGGGGSVTGTSTNQCVSGGGGGGGVFDGILSVVPGTTYTVTIGTGGAGGTTGTITAGSNGTNTTFGSIMTAPGGQGGVSQNGGNSVHPLANPGGSWGGPGQNGVATQRGCASAGGGAGSPIIPSFTTTTGASAVSGTYNFFDGYGQRSFPLAVVPSSAIVDKPNFQSRTGDTFYPRIKRGTSATQCPTGTWFVPGWSWKDLGAGGAPAYFIGGDHLELESFIHPTAGRINISSTTNGTATNYNSGSKSGTDAKSNSGSGGGGALTVVSGGTASGGSGGSGYLEVVWQE